MVPQQNWRPFIVNRYGEQFTDTVLKEARERTEMLIPKIPYIGGDDNPMSFTVVRRTAFEAFNLTVKEQAFVTTYHHTW
jgi:hypothetical protein